MNIKTLFLIDGIGAVISALSLGIILPLFHQHIGVPKQSLYFLSLFPVLYCFYSFGCFSKVKALKSYHLYIIGALNLLYCIVSVFTLAQFLGSLTDLGYGYFLIEIILVLLLAAYEIKQGILLGEINASLQ